jgi:SPP1 gp7 family putative phage head morphogenesis protein
MDTDLLKDVQDSLNLALSQGVPFQEWADNLIPTLQAKGWWGRKSMVDPITGKTVVAQLGSPHRLQTIFRTNLQGAYSVGTWQKIKDQEKDAPWLLYDAVDDFRTRPAHRQWDGKVFRIDDKFWKKWYPPSGFNCRCGVIQLSDDDLEDMGLQGEKSPPLKMRKWTNPRTGQVETVPDGIDPGFDYNPGIARQEELERLAKEKAGALEGEAEKAAQEGLRTTAKVAEETAPPAPPKRKTKADLRAELTERALQDLARSVSIPASADIEGTTAFVDAVADVNDRFNLPKLAYLGDVANTPARVRMPQRASAGYAPSADYVIFRPKALKVDAEAITKNATYAARKGWTGTADILRRAYKNDEAARIADSLPAGRPWTFNHTPQGIAYHEMGHRLHNMNRYQLDVILDGGYRAGWHQLVSEYGSTNKSEFMAEAFTIYMTGTREDWRRIYPPLLEWFRKNDKRQK